MFATISLLGSAAAVPSGQSADQGPQEVHGAVCSSRSAGGAGCRSDPVTWQLDQVTRLAAEIPQKNIPLCAKSDLIKRPES